MVGFDCYFVASAVVVVVVLVWASRPHIVWASGLADPVVNSLGKFGHCSNLLDSSKYLRYSC